MRLSYNFEIPSISNEKPSISMEVPSISIENLGFRSKYQVFRVRNFKILGFSHLGCRHQEDYYVPWLFLFVANVWTGL